jgi:ribA/ribD-fused uncharacterized protein
VPARLPRIMVGLRSTKPNHVAQQRQLDAFLESEQAAFAQGRYQASTRPATPKLPDARLELRPSDLVTDCIGVFATQAIDEGQVLAYYPGVLMTEPLWQKFSAKAHCPTFLLLDSLSYFDLPVSGARKKKTQMTLVGDPTSVGALFNSHRSTGKPPNCLLESHHDVRQCVKRPRQQVRGTRSGSQQLIVSSNIATIRTSRRVQKGEELLISYNANGDDDVRDRDGYWHFSDDQQIEDAFCCVCMGKEDHENLWLCEDCNTGRHAGCMRKGTTLDISAKWWCPRHELGKPHAGPARLPTTPRASSLAMAKGPAPLNVLFRVPTGLDTPPDSPVAQSGSLTPRPSPSPPAVLRRLPSSLDTPPDSPVLAARESSPRDSHPVDTAHTGRRVGSTASHCATARSIIRGHSFMARAAPSTVTAHGRAASTALGTAAACFRMDDIDEQRDLKVQSDTEFDSESDVRSTAQGRSSSTMGSSELTRKPHRAPLSIPPAWPKATTALTEEARAEIRAIRLEFESQSASGKKQQDKGGSFDLQKAVKMEDDLHDRFEFVTKRCHCAAAAVTPGKWNAKAAASTAPKLFTSSTPLFYKAGLEWKRSFNFASANINSHLSIMLRSENLVFNGIKVCDACLVACIGISRATTFRVNASDPAAVAEKMSLKVAAAKRSHSAPPASRAFGDPMEPFPSCDQKIGRAIHAVLAYAEQNGQYRPDGTNEETVLTHHCFSSFFLALKLEHEDLTASTVHRALKWLRTYRSHRINYKRWKGIAQCPECTRFNSWITSAKQQGIAMEIERAQSVLDDHTVEWKQQRAFFAEQKNFALQMPWRLWMITLDGMDTKKTTLPHVCQPSKDFETLPALATRVVGAFCFGAPLPCLAVTACDNILSKGGSMAVTNLNILLEAQWNAMDPDRLEPIPTDAEATAWTVAAKAKAREKAARAFSAVARQLSESDRTPTLVLPKASAVARQLLKSDRAPTLFVDYEKDPFWKKDAVGLPNKAVSFMWPEGLGVCVDNASSDNKNSTFFHYLALLVAAGVFMYVTLSTLLVGHTHDIVDQMFSVWSQMLKITDVPTLEALHVKFREQYQSRIYELEKLAKSFKHARRSRSDAMAMAIATGAADSESQAGPVPAGDLEDLAALMIGGQVAERCADLASELGVQPRMIHAVFCIDMDGWNAKNGNALKPIEAISAPHVFLIRKEMMPYTPPPPAGGGPAGETVDREAVVMYTRHLARSQDMGVVDHPFQPEPRRLGRFSAKKTLLFVHEVPQFDPSRRPPQMIDTFELRKTMKHCRDTKLISEHDQRDFNRFLQSCDDEMAGVTCDICREFALKLSDIGVIHRGSNMTVEEAQLARDKEARKRKLREAQAEHIKTATHDERVEKGWWTNWLTRVEKYIRPDYERRGYVPSAAERAKYVPASGFKPHPVYLPSDQKRALVPLDNWIDRGKPPKIHQLVIVRGTPAYPFWVGKVVRVVFEDDAEAGRPLRQRSNSEFAVAARIAQARPAAIPGDPVQDLEEEAEADRRVGDEEESKSADEVESDADSESGRDSLDEPLAMVDIDPGSPQQAGRSRAPKQSGKDRGAALAVPLSKKGRTHGSPAAADLSKGKSAGRSKKRTRSPNALMLAAAAPARRAKKVAKVVEKAPSPPAAAAAAAAVPAREAAPDSAPLAGTISHFEIAWLMPFVDPDHADLLVINRENEGIPNERKCGKLLKKLLQPVQDPRVLDEWRKALASWGDKVAEENKTFTKLPREWLTLVWANAEYDQSEKRGFFDPPEGQQGVLVTDVKLAQLLIWGSANSVLATPDRPFAQSCSAKKRRPRHRLSTYVFSRIVADLAEIDTRDARSARCPLPENEWNAHALHLTPRAPSLAFSDASSAVQAAAPGPAPFTGPRPGVASVLLMKYHLTSPTLSAEQRASLLAFFSPAGPSPSVAWAPQAEVSCILLGPQAANLVRLVEKRFTEMLAGPPRPMADLRWCPDFSNVHQGLSYQEPVITVDGVRWANSEAYFQAQKFDEADRAPFRAETIPNLSPLEAFHLGQTAMLIPADWSQRRLAVMEAALRAKMAARPTLRKVLLATADATLIQFKNDPIWGCGANGKGSNMLGKIWMSIRRGVRTEMQQQADAAAAAAKR